MKNKKLEANLSMAVSKVFSGLNMNALKYLLPLWMSPLTGATLRCTFAAAACWGPWDFMALCFFTWPD